MADYTIAFRKMQGNEGNYVNDPQDPGGETYRGIARKMNGKWDGWVFIDAMKKQNNFPANLEYSAELRESIGMFYLNTFWNKMQGDFIDDQQIAESIFDFGVNAGLSTSVSLAQMVVGTKPDGIVGENTIKAINTFDKELFLASFTLAKIARYITIVKKRPTSRKYFYGWICRAMEV